MIKENLLKDFVEKVLNEDNQYFNACLNSEDFFQNARNERVTFKCKHREQYNKLLAFCIENNLTIISTQPGTLATVIRIEY